MANQLQIHPKACLMPPLSSWSHTAIYGDCTDLLDVAFCSPSASRICRAELPRHICSSSAGKWLQMKGHPLEAMPVLVCPRVHPTVHCMPDSMWHGLGP